MGHCLFNPMNFMIAGRALVRFAEVILAMAIPLVVISETNSVWAAALVVFITYVPQMFFGFFFSNIVDRFHPSKALIVLSLLQIISVGILLAGAYAKLTFIMPIILFGTNIFSFFLNLMCKVVVRLVVEDKQQLRKDNARLKQIVAISRIIGPAVAGFSIAISGIELAVGISLILMIGSLVCFTSIKIPSISSEGKLTEKAERERFNVWQWFRNTPTAFEILMANFAGGIGGGVLLSLFMYHLLNEVHLNSKEIGIIYAIPGTASLLASTYILLQRRVKIKWSISLMLMNLLHNLALVFIFVPDFWVIGASYLIYHISGMLVDIESISMIQMLSTKKNTSSIIGFFTSICNMSIPLGFIIGASVATLFSTKAAFISMGIGLFIFLLWRARRWILLPEDPSADTKAAI